MIWRVDTRRDFEQLRRGARRRSGPLSVTMGPLDTTRPPRVAFAISRKVGNAPRRNRLRRRLRALMATQPAGLAPASYLLSAQPGASDLSFDQLSSHLTEALRALDAVGADRCG